MSPARLPGLRGMTEPQIQQRKEQPHYATLLHTGPYRSEEVPDLSHAQAALKNWTEANGLATSRPSERGSSLPCCVEHYRIGPPAEKDWTKWETELAYLIVED
jgi:hypothetical protein